MEYCGNPLNLELIDKIVKIPSIEKVIKLGEFFMRLTDGFKEPYVRLLLTKGKTVEEQIEIYDALRAAYDEAFKQQQKEYEEWHKECNRWKDDFRYHKPLFSLDDKFTNAITPQGLNDIAFQLKFLNTPFEPDLGVLIQAYIYRQSPDSKLSKLKGDWYRAGDDVCCDRVINWVADHSYCVNDGEISDHLGLIELDITHVLRELCCEDWITRQNIEDFLQLVDSPKILDDFLYKDKEFAEIYEKCCKDRLTPDSTTVYAQERQSIIDELLAEHQCNYDSDLPMNEEAECGEIDSLKSELDAAKARIRELEDEVAELRSQLPEKIDVEAAIADLCPRYFNDKDVAREFVAFAEGKEDSLIAARIRLYKDREDLVYSNCKEFCDILKKHHLWKTKAANLRSYLRKK